MELVPEVLCLLYFYYIYGNSGNELPHEQQFSCGIDKDAAKLLII